MPLLTIRHLSKAFPVQGGVLRRTVGRVQALQDVSLTLEKGETLALVGGSGCGKSTLAKILSGLYEADSGELLWNDTPLSQMSRRERARKIQMIFQDPYASLNPKLSIGSQLGEAIRVSGQGDPSQLLAAVGLGSDALACYPFQFSGGQRQRIAIARALAMKPELLIADEPLSALDVTTQAQILTLFRQLMKDLGLTFILITHDLAVANEFADRVIVLKAGQIVEEGPVSSVLRKPQHAYTQALISAVPSLPC